MSIVYQYDNNGFYLGKTEDYNGPMPHNTTAVQPPYIQAGFWPHWNGQVWEQVGSHKGEQGWLNSQPHKIKEHGPLPDGFSFAEPPELAEKRRILLIETKLDDNDLRSQRALRAIKVAELKGQPPAQADKDKLIELEVRATELRAELAELK